QVGLFDHTVGVCVPHKVLGDAFALVVVQDQAKQMTTLNSTHFDHWQMTFETALAAARHNLALRSEDVHFDTIVDKDSELPIVYTSQWHDEYDAARILLPNSVSQLNVQGEPFILLLNNNRILITGSESDLGMAIAYSELSAAQEEPRPLPPVPLTISNGEFVRYQLPEENIWHVMYDDLELNYMSTIYQSQKRLLDGDYNQLVDGCRVAAFRVAKNEEFELRSFCSAWHCSVPVLLPKTDFVIFERKSQGHQLLAQASWERVATILGADLELLDLYPQRYILKRFPNERELEKIGTAEMFEQ
ncbi:MAG: hypothetical protein ACRD3W_12995, partial [Terriglobales bacterium]